MGKVRIDKVGNSYYLFGWTTDEDYRVIMDIRFSRWNKEKRCWSIPVFGNNEEKLRNHFGDRLQEIREFVIDAPAENLTKKIVRVGPPPKPAYVVPLIEKLRKWMQYRRYSESSIESYCESLTVFLSWVYPKKQKMFCQVT